MILFSGSLKSWNASSDNNITYKNVIEHEIKN